MPGPGLPLFDLIAAGLLACPSCDAFPPGRAVAENVTGEENRHACRLPWTYSYGHSSGFAPDSLFKAGGDMFRSAHLNPGAKIVINPHICNMTNENGAWQMCSAKPRSCLCPVRTSFAICSEPAEIFPVPKQGILRLQNPMVLVREDKQS